MFGHKDLLTDGASTKGVVTKLESIAPQYGGGITSWEVTVRVVFGDGDTEDVTVFANAADWSNDPNFKGGDQAVPGPCRASRHGGSGPRGCREFG